MIIVLLVLKGIRIVLWYLGYSSDSQSVVLFDSVIYSRNIYKCNMLIQ